jgi:hypothetical protein
MSVLRTNFSFQSNEGGRSTTSVVVWILFDLNEKKSVFHNIFMLCSLSYAAGPGVSVGSDIELNSFFRLI